MKTQMVSALKNPFKMLQLAGLMFQVSPGKFCGFAELSGRLPETLDELTDCAAYGIPQNDAHTRTSVL